MINEREHVKKGRPVRTALSLRIRSCTAALEISMECPQNQKQKTELTCDPAMPVMGIQLKEAM